MVMARLSRMDMQTLRNLPPRARMILVDEWGEPESQQTVLQILRSPDPERALARELSTIVRDAISEETYFEAMDVPLIPPAGQEGLRSSIKRVSSKVRKGVKSVRRRADRVVSKTRLGRAALRVRRKVSNARKRAHRKAIRTAKRVKRRAWRRTKRIVRKSIKKFRKYGAPVISIIGAVLGPFTFGIATIAASLITTGMRMYEARKKAQELKKKSKKQAAAMAAVADEEAKKLEPELDKFYDKNMSVFLTNGITPERWAAFTIDEKLKVIEEIADASPVVDTDADADIETVPGTIYDPLVVPPETQPANGETPVSTAGAEAPHATYVVYVNGLKVGEVGSLGEASALASKNTGVGDRFQMNVNGRSTDLRIRTTGGGQMVVPKEHTAKVQGMTKGQVLAILDKAKGEAKGGGFPTWLLLPVGAVVAYTAIS